MKHKSTFDAALKTPNNHQQFPAEGRSALLALAVLIERIGILPESDQEEFFGLLEAWRKAESTDEKTSIRVAMEEVLAQTPPRAHPMPGLDAPMPAGLQNWAKKVGQKIRSLREKKRWTQEDLASKAGLPHSLIRLLESAEHSATNKTLKKITKALAVSLKEIDPFLGEEAD